MRHTCIIISTRSTLWSVAFLVNIYRLILQGRKWTCPGFEVSHYLVIYSTLIKDKQGHEGAYHCDRTCFYYIDRSISLGNTNTVPKTHYAKTTSTTERHIFHILTRVSVTPSPAFNTIESGKRAFSILTRKLHGGLIKRNFIFSWWSQYNCTHSLPSFVKLILSPNEN